MIRETIFENRYHARQRNDAHGREHHDRRQHRHRARARRRLSGAPVIASDLRASAGLVLAGAGGARTPR